MQWDKVYEKAIRHDGSLLFPERLTHEFLAQARRTMGSYLFANQYQNEVIPEGEKKFKREWLRYWSPNDIPANTYQFAFVDPAIGQLKTHDYTALTVVEVDQERRWFVKVAKRQRINPSEIIELCFTVQEQFKPKVIGIEGVAFQQAIVHFALEEARRRGKHLPVTAVKRSTDKTKEMRILALVPRFEWGTLFLGAGQQDLESELDTFPRGAHDDLLDALASIEDIVYYPSPIRRKDEDIHPNHPDYERRFIERLARRNAESRS